MCSGMLFISSESKQEHVQNFLRETSLSTVSVFTPKITRKNAIKPSEKQLGVIQQDHLTNRKTRKMTVLEVISRNR